MDEILDALEQCMTAREEINRAMQKAPYQRVPEYRNYEEAKFALETALNAYVDERVRRALSISPGATL